MASPIRSDCVCRACQRSVPRPVQFCPWCGAAQVPAPAPAAAAEAGQAAPPVEPVRPVPAPAAPRPAAPAPAAAAPARRPVRWRGMLILLGLAGLVYLLANPPGRRAPAAQVDAARALIEACAFDQAQLALEGLKAAHASARQLDSLQRSLERAIPACAAKAAKAAPRRAASARRSASAESTRHLLAQAEGHIAVADYASAIDKMDVCTAVVDPGSQACARLRAQAMRLQAGKDACLADGGRWLRGRCHP